MLLKGSGKVVTRLQPTSTYSSRTTIHGHPGVFSIAKIDELVPYDFVPYHRAIGETTAYE